MEKVLSQGEIDALFRAAQGESAASALAIEVSVEPWDLREAGMLSKEDLHSVSQLHEAFARNLTNAMESYLREKFEVTLVAVEQLAYRDFLPRFADVNYHGSFRLLPGDERGMLHMDVGLAFPLIDILLGGPGAMPQINREITDVEQSVLENFGRLLCNELGMIVKPLGMEVEFDRYQPPAQRLRVMPPEEKTLTLTFDVTLPHAKGILNIVFPSGVSSALLRKLRAKVVYQRSRGPAVNQERIGNRLLDSAVRLELVAPNIPVRVADLLALEPAVILPLRRSIELPAVLRLRDRDCWSARPVSRSGVRAAQLCQQVSLPSEGEYRA